MRPPPQFTILVLTAVLAVLSWACSPTQAPDAAEEGGGAAPEEADDTDVVTTGPASEEGAPVETGSPRDAGPTAGETEGGDVSPAQICSAAGLAGAVGGGAEAGTLAAMADDPTGAAIAATPVLSSLAAAVSSAGLVQTLDAAPALTILAPTDCAFAELDPAALEAALADPPGRLTTIVGYHIIAGEQIPAAELTGQHVTFTGETITLDGTDVDGQAAIVVPDIQTANATVHLIDAVLVPPSLQDGLTEG